MEIYMKNLCTINYFVFLLEYLTLRTFVGRNTDTVSNIIVNFILSDISDLVYWRRFFECCLIQMVIQWIWLELLLEISLSFINFILFDTVTFSETKQTQLLGYKIPWLNIFFTDRNLQFTQTKQYQSLQHFSVQDWSGLRSRSRQSSDSTLIIRETITRLWES